MDPVYVCGTSSNGNTESRKKIIEATGLVKSLMHSSPTKVGSSINLARKMQMNRGGGEKKKKREGKKGEDGRCVYPWLKGTVSTALFLIPQPGEPPWMIMRRAFPVGRLALCAWHHINACRCFLFLSYFPRDLFFLSFSFFFFFLWAIISDLSRRKMVASVLRNFRRGVENCWKGVWKGYWKRGFSFSSEAEQLSEYRGIHRGFSRQDCNCTK